MDIAAIGCRSLARHKMRSALTALGLVIGVGCVIVVVAIGDGAAKQVRESYGMLGVTNMFVVPGATTRNGIRFAQQSTFTVEDVEAIRQECPSVAYATPQVVANRVQVVAGGLNWSTQIRGGNADWARVRSWDVAQGTFFNEAEGRSDAKICVLGNTVAENLFPNGDAVGQVIRVRNIPLKVIGVFAQKGSNLNGDNQDDFILTPFAIVAKRLNGNPHPGSIILSAMTDSQVDAAWDEIDALLRQRHHIPQNAEADYTIHSQIEMVAASVESMNTLRKLLLAIAAISLVVGGIGIMNIMLVSVTERTREIGLRMAVGAKERHVLTQFLFEAIAISLFGGATGIAIGIAVAYLIATQAEWPIIVSPDSVMLAFAVAGFVGVFFGFYPARKAARLDPIDALRYE